MNGMKMVMAGIALMGLCFEGLGQALLGSGPSVPQLANGAAAWADYDGDGDQDLLMSGSDSLGAAHTVLLKNTGVGLVPDLTQNLAQVAGGDAAWGDVDHDGDPDLVLTGESLPRQSVTIIYQNNGGMLSPISTPSLLGLAYGRVAFGDLDGDGDLDLFLTGFNTLDGFVGMIARNDGGSAFMGVGNPLYKTREWTAVALGDYDQDGLVDIAFCDNSPSFTEGVRTVVLHNLGGLNFTAVTSPLPMAYGGNLGFADLEGDGDLDLLVCGMGNAPVTMIYKYVAGQFLGPAASLSPIGHGEAMWMDYDHDGDADVVTAGMAAQGLEMRVYRNVSGAMTLLQGPGTMPGLANARLAAGDWNGDGHLDFVVTGQDNTGRPAAYLGIWNNNLQRFQF